MSRFFADGATRFLQKQNLSTSFYKNKNFLQVSTHSVPYMLCFSWSDITYGQPLRTTVGELSEGDLIFLKAMLPDEGASKVSDLEKRMDKSSGYISRYRARLIEAGVIEPAGRGKVVFALPDLKEYLMEKHPQAAPPAGRKE